MLFSGSLPFCEITGQILKVISDKVADGELEDASKTIGQTSSELKGTSTAKLRLVIEGEQPKQEEERHGGKTTLSVLCIIKLFKLGNLHSTM